MNNPLISIVMPLYNTEKYVNEAIESVINQTYQNWELIICDDCSNDNSYFIALEYSSKDSRIKVIKNSQNMRQAYSRNKAFKKSKGEFIVILDSDDRMKPNRLEKQLEFLQKNKQYAFVCTNAIMFNNNGDIVGRMFKKRYPSPFDVIRNKGFVYGTIMIIREAFEAVHGYTVSDITQTGEDYDLICKLYSKKYIGANLPEFLYEYRISDVYKRRSYNAYYNETRVALSHIKRGWLSINGVNKFAILYAFFPLFKGLFPQKIIQKYHKIKFR